MANCIFSENTPTIFRYLFSVPSYLHYEVCSFRQKTSSPCIRTYNVHTKWRLTRQE